MSTPFLGTDEERMDALLQHKKVNGSFALCSDALKILNVKQATVASFASAHSITDEVAFNLRILKFLRGDAVKANKKFVMIIRNLEKFLNAQISKKMDLKDLLLLITFLEIACFVFTITIELRELLRSLYVTLITCNYNFFLKKNDSVRSFRPFYGFFFFVVKV
jgi:hypothetical protein